ncbi:MAG: hypothetical protein RMM28_10560 [Thermoleophilia bacterium]|nr:hypothetical protein [Gaiellaceae bacterium]MDW8339567.1 hypothetical protein [Thermoleophilia bacterium]
MGHNRDAWNAEAVVVALYPWEVEVIERGVRALAEAPTGFTPIPREPALAVLGKLDQVLELQGYGGIEGLRDLLAERRGERDPSDDLLV